MLVGFPSFVVLTLVGMYLILGFLYFGLFGLYSGYFSDSRCPSFLDFLVFFACWISDFLMSDFLVSTFEVPSTGRVIAFCLNCLWNLGSGVFCGVGIIQDFVVF